MSKFFRLNREDFWKGLYVAVVVVVLGTLQQMASSHGFDFAHYEWASILDVAWKATGAYLAKNLLSDGSGNPLGMATFKKLGGVFVKVEETEEDVKESEEE